MKRALPLLLVLLMPTPHVAAQTASTVQVRNNVYDPAEIHVPHGGRVTWRLVEGTHTVTSDASKRFDSGAMNDVGASYSFDAPAADVTLYYHCRIHGIPGDSDRFGSGMVGRIVVGAGSPESPMASDVEVRAVPSSRWPSLPRALMGLRPDGRYRIDLGRGSYRPIDLTPSALGFRGQPDPRFELVLRGRGSSTVFSGSDVAIGIGLDGVRVEDIAFQGQRFAALHVARARRWTIEDVTLAPSGPFGVSIDGSPGGSVRRTTIKGARLAGISVRRCEQCDLVVDNVNISSSLQGLSAYGAGSIVVVGSRFEGNGVGIALKSAPDEHSLHRSAHIIGNTFRNNTAGFKDAPPLGAERDLAVGAGVWIDGGAFDVVERNGFSGHSFGVVLTTFNASSRITANAFARSAEADIAWDGIGLGVCIAKNRGPGRSAPKSMPPLAQDLYSCDAPTTLGIPYPLVTARLALWIATG